MTFTAKKPGIAWLAPALLALLAGCGGPDRPLEDGGDDGGAGSCSRHESCEDDELCNDETRVCEPVYGRAWRVGLSSVSVNRAHAPSGDPWDDDGSLPDLQTCLTVVDTERCTDPAPDTATPQFDAFTFETTIEQYQHWEVELCDDDAPADPLCFVVGEFESIYVPTLRAGTLTLLPDDPSRLDDWAVTLSFHPVAGE